MSGVLQVQNENQLEDLAVLNLKPENNGYFYVYVSNESAHEVNFNNLVVQQHYGRVLEENHYYPYGLLIKPLSFASASMPLQGYKFNGKELETDLDLGWYHYGFREYDPVIGRFTAVDKLASEYMQWTPFQFSGLMPTKFVDREGLEPAYYDVGSGYVIPASDYLNNGGSNLSFYDHPTENQKALGPVGEIVHAIVSEFTTSINTFTSGYSGRFNRDATVGDYAFEGANLLMLGAVGKGEGKTPSVKTPLEPYEVGPANKLYERSVKGDGIEVHHVIQQQAGKQMLPNYSKKDSPAIALPRKEHQSIPNQKGNIDLTPRAKLASDINNLRIFTNAPNSQLNKLIDLNKTSYPDKFKK